MREKIGFIGLGKLGLPCAEVFSSGYDVYGYDTKPVTSDLITICSSIEEVVQNCELIFIAVQTPHHPEYGGESPTSHLEKKNFDYGFLKDSLAAVSDYATDSHTIIIISTVLPGTIRNELAPVLKKGTLLYNPYLIAMGTVKEDMVQPEMVIIGSEYPDHPSVKNLIRVYEKILAPDQRFETGTWEEAESIKIFYNTFISAKIGIVNMILDVAEKNGHINVDVVTNALAQSSKRITGPAYMRAGMGDGGPCHPRDNIALSWLAQNLDLGYDFFSAIIESREIQARNLALKLKETGLPVVILGCSYKPDVTLTDGSYALLTAHYLQQENHTVFLDNAPDASQPFAYLLGHHKAYDESIFNAGSTVIDPWRNFQSGRTDLSIIHYGNTR